MIVCTIDRDFGNGNPTVCRVIETKQGVQDNIRFFAQLPSLYRQLTKSPVDSNFAEFAEKWGNKFILITHGETLVAAATFILVWMPSKRRGLIEDVVVDVRYRHAGLGTALIEQLIKIGKEAGCQYIQLTSKPGRTAANNFYPKLGFELVANANEKTQNGTNLYRYFYG